MVKVPAFKNEVSEGTKDVHTVVHVFRSPFGGLFRHVCDLVKGQAALGLHVGVLCDSQSGDEESSRVLNDLKEHCALGVHRIPISRALSIKDGFAGYQAITLFRLFKPDIIHGHGAKGGALARGMAPFLGAKAIYIPHGGALHFDNSTAAGLIYMTLEKILKRFTDGVIFESDYARRAYEDKIGKLKKSSTVIYNGLKDAEFSKIDLNKDAVDFLYMGELRELKGIMVLLHAAAQLKKHRTFTMLLAGAGPDEQEIKDQISSLELEDEIEVIPPVYPARAAFARARCLVLPSLAESLPYMVLEVAAAGMPLITTNVGGIPEIYDSLESRLLPPADVDELMTRMEKFLDSSTEASLEAQQLQAVVKKRFSYEKMVREVISYYNQVLD